MRARIIPARAGFTCAGGIRAPTPADHPRSRGVYRGLDIKGVGRQGSSPLARGLPAVLRAGHDVWGIIPARAGFTRLRRRCVRGRRDHPRSRGVYDTTAQTSAQVRGSSPLARGLLVRCRGSRTMTGDHPRSRGVYAFAAFTAPFIAGSSPLARGLRVHRRAPGGCTGIIPARAGFTRGLPEFPQGGADHPRSRGVYPCSRRWRPGREGSSPLARGLPARAGGRDQARRIIPARAGFTGLLVPGVCAAGDHPRSRGVYSPMTRATMRSRGSSPLARGLPLPHAPLPYSSGIIPARAGFTRGERSETDRRRDHPRSRGVYTSRRPGRSAGPGSSPLARGLLLGGLLLMLAAGIIPARAGFTAED